MAKDLEVELLAETGTAYTCVPKLVLFFDNGIAGSPTTPLLYAYDNTGSSGAACRVYYDPVSSWPLVELQGSQVPDSVGPGQAGIGSAAREGGLV